MADTQAFCTECGAPLDGARFCPACGHKTANNEHEEPPGVEEQAAAQAVPRPLPRRRNRLLTVVLGIALLAVVGAGAGILLSGNSGRSPSPADTSAGPQTTHQTSTQPTQQSTNRTVSTAVTEGEAKALAYMYAAAYSGKKLTLLGSLLTSDFRRTNAGESAQDRAEALATYAQQFSTLEHPRYELSNMKVTRTHDTALVTARYLISSDAGTVTGGVTLDMVRDGGKLKISRIIALPDSTTGTSGAGSSGTAGSGATGSAGGSTGATGQAGATGTSGSAGGASSSGSSGEDGGGLLWYGPTLPIVPVPNLG